MEQNDLDYLHRRAAEELSLADSTDDSIAAQVHRRMASLYVSRIAELSGEPGQAAAPLAADSVSPD